MRACGVRVWGAGRVRSAGVSLLCSGVLVLGLAWSAPGVAWAGEEALAPVVSTGAASVLSPEAVTLSGSVDPEGSPTVYEFDLGIDTTYGTRVFADAGETPGAATVSLTVTGLAPGTTYHYRIAASNADGVSYGADATFTTPVYAGASLPAPATEPLIATPTVTFPAEATGETSAPAVEPKHKKPGGKKAKKRRKKRGKAAGRARKSAHGGERGGAR